MVLEVDAAALAAFAPPAGRVSGVIVKGTATRAQLSQLRLRLKPRGITVRDARRARQVAAHPIQLGDERERRAAGVEPHAAAVDREQRRADQDRPGRRSRDAVPLADVSVDADHAVGNPGRPGARKLSRGDRRSRQLRRGSRAAAARALPERPAARPAAGARVVDGHPPRDRVLRVEPAEPLSARRDDRRGDGRPDALVRGDEPAGASHAAVRPDPAGQVRRRRAISRSSIC